MGTGLTIRSAETSDSAAVAALLFELGYAVDSLAFMAQSLGRQLADPNVALLVAVADSHVVGVISLYFIPQLALPGDFCRISYFCVAPRARGNGVGAALEAAACAMVRARGGDRIEVHCHSRRTLAHRFYARQGYTESPKYLIKSLGDVSG